MDLIPSRYRVLSWCYSIPSCHGHFPFLFSNAVCIKSLILSFLWKRNDFANSHRLANYCPLDKEYKLNVQRLSKEVQDVLLNVLYTFKLHPVSIISFPFFLIGQLWRKEPIQMLEVVYSESFLSLTNICGALHDLVPFVPFKKREKHPLRIVNFSKVAAFSLQLY